jgi:RNA polymerase sigma-70 factor (family 1)
MYQNHTDQELIALINQGDEKAFAEIYKRYVADLFRYARKTIYAKEDCEEIIQEVFISLWERRESLRILSLKYYLINAVRYKVIRYIQHNKVRLKYAEHFKLFEAMYESFDDEDRSPESIQSKLLNTISELPDRCQIAIKLRLLENLSNGEIAERMNITKKTVEVYMLKAFNHFRSSYNKIYKTG